MTDARIQKALDIAFSYGNVDGSHHKMWTIDQMVRALTGCPMVQEDSYQVQGESEEYKEWVREVKQGEDGPETYEWDIGIAP